MGVSSTCMSSLNFELSILTWRISWCLKCASKFPDILSNTNKSPRKITTDVLVVESLVPFVIYYSSNGYGVTLRQSKANRITLSSNSKSTWRLLLTTKVGLTDPGMIPSQSHNEIAWAIFTNPSDLLLRSTGSRPPRKRRTSKKVTSFSIS